MRSRRSDPDPGGLDRVVHAVTASAKYAHVVEEVVRRVAAESLGMGTSEREALKRTRRKLHQLTGAFGVGMHHRRIEALVAGLEETPREPRTAWLEALSAASLEILGFQSSTAERRGECEEIYRAVFGELSTPPRRVLDLGCGLNPFALPWMRLDAGTEYRAVDLDTRLAGLVTRYLRLCGQAGAATADDILGGALPCGPWDIAFLLKLLPTLERERRGASENIIRSLDASLLVISFPRASLGGKRKGMDDRYEEELTGLAGRCRLVVERRLFASETVYLCRKA